MDDIDVLTLVAVAVIALAVGIPYVVGGWWLYEREREARDKK